MTPLSCQDSQLRAQQAADRSTVRDTFFYASDDRDTQLGGLYTSPGITNDNFHSMVEIVCQFSDTFELRDDNGQFVARDDEQLRPGNYYIVTNAPDGLWDTSIISNYSLRTGSTALTEEVPLLRTSSKLSGTRTGSFHEAVRHRDGGCVLTGRPIFLGRWVAMQIAHIFPLAYEGHWNHYNYHNLTTIPPDRESDGTINSVQNGIVLSSEMFEHFNNYLVAINPYDEYKIVCFGPETIYSKPLTHVDPLLRQNIGWPPDELLYWHFRQAVLTNMKGVGEPCFENYFPPGSDIMGEIMSGPKAAERMEFELFGRLNAFASCG